MHFVPCCSPPAADLVLATGLVPQLLPLVVDGRSSVAEILLRVGFTEADFARMTVSIGDHDIPLERWHRVRPKPVTELLMRVGIRPLGGDGGNILGIVLGVLLVAGAIAISGGALAFTVGGAMDIGLGGGTLLFGAGSFEASLAAAAVLGLGQMGLNALFPSSVKPKNEAGAELGQAGARSNVLRSGEYLPRPWGRVKMWPPQVTKPLRFFEGRDEVVEALYAVAGRTVLSDVRIGGVPAENVAGVTVQVIDWNSALEEQTLLQQYGAMKAVGRPLQWYSINKANGTDLFDQAFPEKSVPAWDMLSFPDADEWRIRLVWTEGFCNKTDNTVRAVQPMRFRIRPRGSSTWVNLPEVWFSNDDVAQQYKKDIIIRRGPTTPTPAVTDSRKTAWQAYARVPGQGRYPVIGNGDANGVGSIPAGRSFCLVTGGSPAAPIATGYPTVGGAPANGTIFYLKVLEPTPAGTLAMVVDGVALSVVVGSDLEPATIYQMTYNSAGPYFQTVTPIGTNTFVGLQFEPKTDGWQSHTYYTSAGFGAAGHVPVVADQNMAMLDEGVVFFITDAMLAHGPVEVELIAGASIDRNSFGITTYSAPHWSFGNYSTRDFFTYTQHPNYAPKYGPPSVESFSGPVAVNELAAILKAPPTSGISKSEASLIAVRGRNVQVGDVTAIATSVVYDRVSESWIETRSPAKLSEALSRGDSTHRAVAAGVDEVAYDAWQAECVARGYEVGFETAGGRWDDIQKTLASGGRAGFAMARRFRPYFDRDRSAEQAVMAFTPSNSRFLGLTRSWAPVRTDALRVTWREETDDYLEQSEIVYAPGVDPASYRGLEDVAYPEVTKRALALDRAEYDLALMKYRGTRLSFETDHAAEAVQKGDLVVGVYDVLAEIDQSHGVNERAMSQSSYVTQVTRNGFGQVTAIALDRPVYVEPSSANFFALPNVFVAPNVLAIGDPMVGLVTVGRDDPDDAQQGHVLSLDLNVSVAGATTSVGIVPGTVPRSGNIAPGQIFAVGRRRRLRRRCIVESIMPQGGFFKVVLVPEAPELYQ